MVLSVVAVIIGEAMQLIGLLALGNQFAQQEHRISQGITDGILGMADQKNVVPIVFRYGNAIQELMGPGPAVGFPNNFCIFCYSSGILAEMLTV